MGSRDVAMIYMLPLIYEVVLMLQYFITPVFFLSIGVGVRCRSYLVVHGSGIHFTKLSCIDKLKDFSYTVYTIV